MLITIPELLSKAEVEQIRTHLDSANWQAGSQTAGSIARKVKKNQQLDDSREPAISLGHHIVRALSQHPTFISAALPDKIYPPKFNRYSENETYGAHVDAALMQIPETNQTLRTDLSATIFLAEPDEYEGGELSIETQYGAQTVKLAAGDMVLYREMLFDLDQSVQQLSVELGQTHREVVKLSGIYHNLLRQWAKPS